MKYSLQTYPSVHAFLAAVLALALLGVAYLTFEPIVSGAATSSTNFTVTQSVTSEISFLATSSVTMSPSLAGQTGGTSYGTSTTRVHTNNSSGYSMTIKFASTTALLRGSGGGWIPNYTYSTSTANYPAGFDTSLANAQFGFTANASDTTEISPVFTQSGTKCGTSNSGTFTVNSCWRGASTTDQAYETELINSSAATPPSGSTTTVQFRVTIPNNPSPVVPNGTYVATATLTASTNP